MNLNGQKVLVTGAGGFIGSHLVETLVTKGAEVKAFIRYNSRADLGLLSLIPDTILSKIEIIAGDLRDANALYQITKNVDTIFHLGALIAIPYSYQNPRDVIDTNIMGTVNILEAARAHDVRKIIHTSTSEVYGTAQYVPIDEKHPLQGQSPYSASKIGADKIVESYYCSFDLPVVTIRPFNTYGPRQSARAIIPTIITQVLTKDEIHLGSLDPCRDLTFVSDTVNGFICAAETEAGLGEEINLGVCDTISIGDLAYQIFALMNKSPKIITDQARIRPDKSEVLKLYSQNQKAADLIGWTPKVSLDEGLLATIEWLSQYISHYRPDEYTV